LTKADFQFVKDNKGKKYGRGSMSPEKSSRTREKKKSMISLFCQSKQDKKKGKPSPFFRFS